MSLAAATKPAFDEFLSRHPMAVPDGFRIVGGFVQSRWMLDGEEIARESTDSGGTIFEIAESRP